MQRKRPLGKRKAETVALSNQTPAPQHDRAAAEIGTVDTVLDGVIHTGFYRVRAGSEGRQRYRVTADKTITVNYKGRHKHTAIGMRGLQSTAEILLAELVRETPATV
jgi:hypothetical protein